METAWLSLRLRPWLIALGMLGLLALLYPRLRARIRGSLDPSIPLPGGFPRWLAGLTVVHFLLAYLQKLSQLLSLRLNAQDFWLFEDMLRFTAEGAPFLTRFAPQALGPVQHGAVHSFLNFGAIGMPLTWLFGPTQAALIFAPLVLALAGTLLARVARPAFGDRAAIALALAFWHSNLWGRLLGFDVHPEVAYPLFLIGAGWAAGWGDGRIRGPALVAFVFLGTVIKSDSFAVFPSLLAASALFARPGEPRTRRTTWLALAGAACLVGIGLHFWTVARWKSGAWGPSTWQGFAVVAPGGAGAIGGISWDSPAAALRIIDHLSAGHGGPLGLGLSFLKNLVSRPWLELFLIAPWALGSRRFILAALPLGFALTAVGSGTAALAFYSGAGAMGLLWLSAAAPLDAAWARRLFASPWQRAAWSLIVCLLLGSGGLEWHFPSRTVQEVRETTRAYAACLAKIPSGPRGKLGSVPPYSLLDFPRDAVWTDRLPESPEAAPWLSFVIVAEDLHRWEVGSPQARDWIAKLSADPHWKRWGRDCTLARPPAAPREPQLWVRGEP